MTEPLPRIAFRPPEVAVMLGVSRSQVYEWIDKGTLPSVRVGATIMVLRSAIDDFLTRHAKSA